MCTHYSHGMDNFLHGSCGLWTCVFSSQASAQSVHGQSRASFAALPALSAVLLLVVVLVAYWGTGSCLQNPSCLVVVVIVLRPVVVGSM